MLRFIARRILELIPVLLIIATVTFFMTRMAPGGPFDSEKNTTPEIRKAIEAYYGLDKPLLAQYLKVMKGYLKGDLGPDYKYPNRSVQELILGAFPVSLELGCLALAIALAIGITAGLIAAGWQKSPLHFSALSPSLIGIFLPPLVMGPLLGLGVAIPFYLVNASRLGFSR